MRRTKDGESDGDAGVLPGDGGFDSPRALFVPEHVRRQPASFLHPDRPFQGNRDHRASLIIGIEEPETAFHPGAFAALRKALERASERKKVLITRHSPELLDEPKITHQCTTLHRENQKKFSFLIPQVTGFGNTDRLPLDGVWLMGSAAWAQVHLALT